MGYPKTLQDVIDFNEANPELEGPWDSEIFELAEATNGRDAACAAIRAEADGIAETALTEALRRRRDDRADEWASVVDRSGGR